MTQINLLPWREKAREVKKLRFIALIGLIIGITLFLLLLIHLYMNNLISAQQRNNDFFQSALNQEQATLFNLNKKKKEKNALKTNLEFLFSLRNQSYKAVRLLNELTQLVPENVKLIKLVREGNTIKIIGKSASNLQVTVFMENISQSTIFKHPKITELSEKEHANEKEKLFQLTVEQQE